jgi:hypothetical protein
MADGRPDCNYGEEEALQYVEYELSNSGSEEDEREDCLSFCCLEYSN